ncbi:hypothetical protein HZH66_005612 [Vespula vulgaris]|uniref:EF-hand domain-containing protein n=1 Tax=Vespula vulgaris TaxID=7454 RepID=A0A834NAL7_VESVU|nr:hypothetical protein HZH66_005612 [Vespula vulgaris]
MSQTADAESETGSICDEERVRKLFQACDGDGDGFIDSQDLLTVCRELNLENSVEELMRELGADEHGRISYQEFLRRRLALRPEIEALRSGKHRTSPHHTHTPEYLPTSSDNSLGTVSGRHESWEFDSGARDLSPEPHTLQKLVEAAAGGSGNMLDLANKLDRIHSIDHSTEKRDIECNSSKNNDGKSNDESNKVANFTVAINNDSTESTYFVDRLRRQQQHQQQQQQQYQLQQYLQRTSRCGIQTLSSHIPSNAAKDIVEDELRNDLVYVHCATTEDEDIDEDDEEEEPTGLARSRSWLCCPGDRRSERTVPVHVEMDYTDKQHSVSSKFPNQDQQPMRI